MVASHLFMVRFKNSKKISFTNINLEKNARKEVVCCVKYKWLGLFFYIVYILYLYMNIQFYIFYNAITIYIYPPGTYLGLYKTKKILQINNYIPVAGWSDPTHPCRQMLWFTNWLIDLNWLILDTFNGSYRYYIETVGHWELISLMVDLDKIVYCQYCWH